jgi:DNA-binding transcriptional ArsR family regulator
VTRLGCRPPAGVVVPARSAAGARRCSGSWPPEATAPLQGPGRRRQWPPHCQGPLCSGWITGLPPTTVGATSRAAAAAAAWHRSRNVQRPVHHAVAEVGDVGGLQRPGCFQVDPPPWSIRRRGSLIWTPDERRDDALESLLGRRRAQVLLELDRPASTLELAQRMGVSPGSVSGHLTTLRRAGLVMRRREGRRVVYARTATGDDLRAPQSPWRGALQQSVLERGELSI